MPAAAIPEAGGIVLHDCHAETVAIRAFNRYLVNSCHQLAINGPQSGSVVERRQPHSTAKQLFSIRDDVKILMYCSEVPCGSVVSDDAFVLPDIFDKMPSLRLLTFR